jgi:hypothetical protein
METIILDINALNLFSHAFSTNYDGRWFLIINNAKSSKNSFC